jgi:hypothetical protein
MNVRSGNGLRGEHTEGLFEKFQASNVEQL